MMTPWYRLAQRVSGVLPPDRYGRLAEWIMDWWWRWAAGDRAGVQANLSAVLGEAQGRDPALAREVFRHFGRYLAEFLSAHQRERYPFVVEGLEPFEKFRGARPGPILLSAHIGNWEVAAIAVGRLGLRTGVVALPHQDPRVNQFFVEQRARCGVETIILGAGATKQAMRFLQEGGMLGMLGDWDFAGNGLAVSCFGRRASVPRGPAVLSLRTGAPALPVFFIREGPWRFRFHVEPPIWPKAGDTVESLTQRYTEILERAIRRWPTQWMRFRPFDNAGDAAYPQSSSPRRHLSCAVGSGRPGVPPAASPAQSGGVQL